MRFSRSSMVAVLTLAAVGSWVSAASAAFTAGNLVVSRVGDGSVALTSNSAAVFLDEYTTVGGSPVGTVSLPTATTGSAPTSGNRYLVNSGSATSEAALTRSADGHYLTIAGYNSLAGVAGVVGTASSAVARVVGLIDAYGNVDTTTAISTLYSGNNIRSVVTVDGSAFWTAGPTNGVSYVTLGGGTTTQLSTTVVNTRVANIFNNQLFVSTSSGTFKGVNTVGTGLPTTSGQTIVNPTGFNAGSTSAYDYVLLDTNADTLPDVAYLADDSANSNGGIQKWILSGTTWSRSYVIGTGVANIGARSLTIDDSGNIYAITAEGTTNRLIKVVDGGSTALSTATTLATASTNEIFRGVDFAPVAAPEPASLGLLGLGVVGLIGRRKSR
ncbi:MAG: PEP-CTERM sorting domain-containing protein [Phycisphaerae bacterium]